MTTLTAVRTGVRAGVHERIAFEFAGPPVPGYTIEYEDAPPASCGSGRRIEVAGDAYLTGLSAHSFTEHSGSPV